MEEPDCWACSRMKFMKIALPLLRMKKWSGGMVIAALALILVFSYSQMGITQPEKKKSAYDFFRNHPANDSYAKDMHRVRPSRVEVKKTKKSSMESHLVNVEGLNDLYAPRNISNENQLEALVAWNQMRFLLCRSDALPETAQGIKEASIAWKDLLTIINENKAHESNTRDKAEDRTCSYSVISAAHMTELSNGTILDIPCGLVEDSSITLVGIPDEYNGSFYIELQGSQLLGEQKPPIVLHYKVRLPSNNMTEEPSVHQNTWTQEHGWGKEEICPAHRSISSPKLKGRNHCVSPLTYC